MADAAACHSSHGAQMAHAGHAYDCAVTHAGPGDLPGWRPAPHRAVRRCAVLQRMSGIASATAAMVAAAKASGSATRILETRKTVPGLRVFDKWAVLIGGGTNHRMGLYDMMMIKDNHIAAAGGITAAVQRAEDYIRCVVPARWGRPNGRSSSAAAMLGGARGGGGR